jgi:hypothetical protein
MGRRASSLSWRRPGDKYKGHFFLCDFRGTAGNSGV